MNRRLGRDSSLQVCSRCAGVTITSERLKELVGQAALAYLVPGAIIGVGTGSTVDCFIDALATVKDRLVAAVSSSERSTARLRSHGIRVLEVLPSEVPVYVDGADEIDHAGHMVKGGGGALTREKIVSDLAHRFICIADESKLVTELGAFGVPLEVLPLAVGSISRKVRAIGGAAVLREGFVTDNGGSIIDVKGLHICDPVSLEAQMNQWPGVVTVGLFAQKKASVCLLGTQQGVKTLTF